MNRARHLAILGAGICLAASQGSTQQAPPPNPPPPSQPPTQQPPQEQNGGDQNNGNRPPGSAAEENVAGEDGQRMSWYNGDYVVKSISSVRAIDDPVTGFGNEALWTNPAPLPDPGQSDVAGPADPD